MKDIYRRLIIWVWESLSKILIFALITTDVYAFTKLKNGFETITETYLIPLSTAVAGASFIVFVTLSYFKQEEYQKKVGNVLAMAVLSATGLEIITNLIQSFS